MSRTTLFLIVGVAILLLTLSCSGIRINMSFPPIPPDWLCPNAVMC